MYQVNVGIDIWFAGLEGTLYIYDNTHCGNENAMGCITRKETIAGVKAERCDSPVESGCVIYGAWTSGRGGSCDRARLRLREARRFGSRVPLACHVAITRISDECCDK